MTDQLAIILPCYNPPVGWGTIALDGYQMLQGKLGFAPKLIVVNDGSPGDLSEAIQVMQASIPDFEFIHCEINQGKGAALRHGVAHAEADFYIYTDIDLPYTVESIGRVYEALLRGADVVAGVKDEAYYLQTPTLRRWISKAFRFAIKHLLSLRISDTQCGLKGFNHRGRAVFLATKIDRYLFDLEFIYQASKTQNKLQVESIKAQLRPGIIFRKMNPKILLQELKNFVQILFGL